MKGFFEEYTDKTVCGAYLKGELLKLAKDCDNEENAANLCKLAEKINENEQYVERITREFFEGESDQKCWRFRKPGRLLRP